MAGSGGLIVEVPSHMQMSTVLYHSPSRTTQRAMGSSELQWGLEHNQCIQIYLIYNLNSFPSTRAHPFTWSGH